MTVLAIRETLHAGEPFSVIAADGKVYEVPHPDFASLNKTGRLLSIWVTEAKQVTLDVALLLGIEQTATSKEAESN
ncbi:MAG: hypothetical protein AAGH89_07540 [Verrucomicrobiota bacterium]